MLLGIDPQTPRTAGMSAKAFEQTNNECLGMGARIQVVAQTL
jgi:hypothetical protein